MSLREDIEALVARLDEWSESHHNHAVQLGYPDSDNGNTHAGLADAFNHAKAALEYILARHPEPKHEARKPHPNCMAGR